MGAVSPKLAVLAAVVLIAGCTEGTRPYAGGPNTVIATAYDQGRDTGRLTDADTAIAYDPDGCQVWLMDDGVEGYASRRRDRATGLPVCNEGATPGAVVRTYQTTTPGIPDFTPIRTGNVRR